MFDKASFKEAWLNACIHTIDIMENFVNVTLPFTHEKNNGNEKDLPSDVYINDAKKQLIELIGNCPSITIKELVSTSGYSDGYVRKLLTSLKVKRIIKRQGGNKIGQWVIIG